MSIEVQIANYKDKKHAKAIGYLMNVYAEDPMGDGTALPELIQQSLANELSKIPHAFTVIGFVDKKPAGLINCFEAFSTFKCKPLINIHDIIVVEEFRSWGISQKMLTEVEKQATDRGCCKLTLEVLEGNEIAQKAYQKFGFDAYELDPKMGKALFWQKVI